MESLVLNQYCLKVKCHLTFCRTSYAHTKEDPFVVKDVFRITMVNETCIFCGFKRSKCPRERPFNLKGGGGGGLWLFSKKNILIPNVAEKNILNLVEEKKNNLIQSFCHINILTLVLSENFGYFLKKIF